VETEGTPHGAAFPQACAGWGGFLVKCRQLKIAGVAALAGRNPGTPVIRVGRSVRFRAAAIATRLRE
jgi:hypothetical protein